MGLPIEIDLPEHFLEKEVRCGYEVSEKLKKIWAVQMDLLQHLLDICKKYQINVQVFIGTLLGAVRHKGMIPWDDDIDVAMARPDFEKFCKVAPKELQGQYFFQTALSDRKFFLGFGRLRNSLTTGVITDNESCDYNNGIYIDVYVLDGLSDSKILNKIQSLLQHLVVKCCTTYGRDCRRNNSPVEIASRLFRPLIRLFPFEWWYSLYNKILSMWTGRTDKLALQTHFDLGKKYCIKKSELADTIEMPFENMMVPVTKAYDAVLSRIYGDYMSFPPPEQRGKWHEGQIHFEPDIPYKEYLSKLVHDAK